MACNMDCMASKPGILLPSFKPILFVASPFAGKPLSHTQTAVRGERCPNFREAA